MRKSNVCLARGLTPLLIDSHALLWWRGEHRRLSSRVHDAIELRTVLAGCLWHVRGVDHEALAVHVQDPDPVDLSGALLITIASPAQRRPGLEVALVAGCEVDRAWNRDLNVLAAEREAQVVLSGNQTSAVITNRGAQLLSLRVDLPGAGSVELVRKRTRGPYPFALVDKQLK